MILGCNGDILQVMDGTPPEAITTTGAVGPTSAVMASIVKSWAYIGRGTVCIYLG